MKRAMKAANVTQAEVARRTGVDRSYVAHQLSGSREMTFDVARVLAEALSMSEAEVLHRAGLIGSDLPSVPVMGHVDDAGRVHWLREPARRVVAPMRGAESDSALEDRSGRAMHGWTLYLSRSSETPLDLSGSLAVVTLKPGAAVVRLVSPGARTGTIDLLGERLGLSNLVAADVANARRVVWIKP